MVRIEVLCDDLTNSLLTAWVWSLGEANHDEVHILLQCTHFCRLQGCLPTSTVILTGSFSAWRAEGIPMTLSADGTVFAATIRLPLGRQTFK